ncbi:phage protein [Bifidobacterium parmae]|uniref:Phage protein n=1 Tax=Bifidobacterium parmae TaxID=361854 RepID=A0A2N5IWB2_9BIFI|nr:phage protein [Bifidobacterium parmae]
MDTLSRLELEAGNLASGMVWDGESPELVKQAMVQYAEASNELTASYYQSVRDTWSRYMGVDFPAFTPASIDADRAVWQIEGGFANTDFNGLTYKQVMEGRSRAGKTIDDLWPSFTVDKYMDAYRYAKELVRTTARLTVERSAAVDPTRPKYARVPTGSYTCAFCVMCASRGFDYSSEETAGKFKPFHTGDDCRIIPSWGVYKFNAYNPEYYMSMYEAAKNKAPDTSSDAICAEMRRLYPKALTDGVFKDDAKFTKDNSLRYGIWRANRVKAMHAHSFTRSPLDLIPPPTPAEAPEWPSDLPLTIRAKEWNHILYGSDDGGGHLHGYGWQNPGKTVEFPEHWTADDIRDAGITILDSKENRAFITQLLAEGKNRGTVSGTIDGIEIKVAFAKAGKGTARVTSMFPVRKE